MKGPRVEVPAAWPLVALLWLAVAGGAHGEEEFLRAGGVRLRYETHGSGEPVVLLHGYASGIEHGWRAPGVLEGLKEAGFRVIALEQRGHGESDKPHGRAYGSEMVDDVRRLLDRLGIERAHLVGYSMGALIANAFRDRYPERLTSVVVAGFGPFLPAPDTFTEEFAQTVEANLSRLQVSEQNDARALAWLAVQWSEWWLTDHDLTANRVPTLALIGDEDHFLADTRRLAATMPSVVLRLVPGDHQQAPNRPEFLAEVLRFIRAPERPEGATPPERID